MPFNPANVIARKRDGAALSRAEIADFIDGFTKGSIPDYQMSALAMAIYLRGMSADETALLTEQMLASGVTMQWDGVAACVDKHSTGGIGDKVSLLLAPLLACCGLRVPMISGRGLGPTGGTLDKLESIPGFRTDLSLAEIDEMTNRVGCVITGASTEIAPADRKLYALRDVTATVASIPLITASIMSKKLAEGLDALVLDVKVGSGAFMKTVDAASELARSLVETGTRMGVKTTALLSDMSQPLGKMAGNAIEVDEAVAALAGDTADDLIHLTNTLGAELLVASGIATTIEEGRQRLQQHIESGRGLEKFREMVSAQGGDLDTHRPIAPATVAEATRAGFVSAIDVEALGYEVIHLGGGRRVMSDSIDHSVGIETLVAIGDRVERGQPLARVFASSQNTGRAGAAIASHFTVQDESVSTPPLIIDRISDLP
ncbi:MAG: thymidine phosphorylase [Planctomycetaceae bacterium]|nr:thymidine phosphorylase [Planctomycetales bacterium]MCB9926598.1 thymidine phosphorylase [Planctomycetaceae bacterium]